MLPIIAGVVTSLLQNNLPKVANAVLEKGLDAVGEKLGIDLTPEEKDGKYSLTAEQIKEVQLEAQKHEEFKMEQDTKSADSAREMQKAALGQEDQFSKRFVYYFASFWSFIAGLYIFGVTFVPIAETGLRMADTLTGVVIGSIIMPIITYFYGSSHSSKGKTDKMLELVKESNSAK